MKFRNVLFILIILGGIYVFVQKPMLDRNWDERFAQLPQIEQDGGEITIKNVRDFEYDAEGNVIRNTYREKKYQKDRLVAVDVVWTPPEQRTGEPNLFLTFRFTDGQTLSLLSVARLEDSETYSPLMGLFRQYELAYIFAEETDAIGKYSHSLNQPIYIFPVENVEPADVRELFFSVLEQIEESTKEPQFYNSLFGNLTKIVVDQIREITGEYIPMSVTFYLSRQVEDVAFELRLVDLDMAPSLVEKKYRVKANDFDLADPRFSKKLRGLDR